ncbi:hypothetical protein G6M89_05960 [Natronolimnobius sp. AArcel1]|uniref:HalOD1 output domain-containing protein n=1 Tax=Natronolimnobius sp. AArcel1 TaxID=1679093 RepID=UPI0013ED9B4F|nr:HalOD1 output domain-containing protein [Natronolimnobius sp. AArcel1]NGM68560.1 hypothetical protein [Natronolimnobius sp. AArcel1]
MSGSGAREEPVVDHVQADESLSHAILRVVADAREESVLELSDPLFDAIDPDALETIFQEHSNGYIEFSYLDCTVRVTATGKIRATQEPADGEG